MNKHNRIMLVTRSALIGGVEEHVYQLARQLISEGCSVLWVVLSRSQINAYYRQLDGLHFLNLNDSEGQSVTSFYLLGKALKLVWRFKPRVVHLHGIRPMLIFSLIPFPPKVLRISTVHGSYLCMAMNNDTGNVVTWKCIVSKLFHIFSCIRSHCVFAVSQAVAREIIRLISPFPFNRLRIVYNGVDLSPDLSGTIPEKYSETFQPDELQIVYLGRLDVKKGVELLIRAVASVSPHLKVRCHFFGDGYQKERFERLASDNNVSERIHFWGYSPDVRKWLHKFDVLVLPSFTEGMGIAILEAMAAGLPVIATNIGGIPEAVIDGETGYLVEPGDLNALAKRLEDLYRHKDKRVALGLAGKERVNHVFNLEFQIPKIIENYHLN